jgi:TonB family protein
MGKLLFTLLASVVLACLALAQNSKPEEPRLVTAVAPAYPQLALLSATSGEVIVDVKIGDKGDVLSAVAKEGHKLLRQAAEETARRWQFDTGGIQRTVQVVFAFRVMPKGTPAAELTTIFRAPYRVEVRRTIPDIAPDYNAAQDKRIPPQ